MQSTAVFYLLVLNYRYTLSQKCTNFETLQLKIIWINFLGIWQKYSKDSRIEFAFVNFSCFKPDIENIANFDAV